MSTINKTLTIGVEIEMNGIARSDAAEIAAEFFGTDRHEYEGNGYDTYVAFDAQGRKWKFMRDSSINGPDGEKCELVTPILHYSDIETLQELVRRLRKAEAVSSEFEGCGIHVHIGRFPSLDTTPTKAAAGDQAKRTLRGPFFVCFHTQYKAKKILKMTCLTQNFEYNRL